MDLSEAVSLGLVEEVLKSIVPLSFTEALEEKFARAREKLLAIPNLPVAKWREIVRHVSPGPAFIPAAVREGIPEAVQDSLLRRKQLGISYRSLYSGTAKPLDLHPLALIQQGPRTYLLATAFEYADPTLYALQRMDSAESLDCDSIRPPEFDLESYLSAGGARFGHGDPIILKARVSDEICLLLRETPLSRDQRLVTRGGDHFFTATVPDSWQLRFWILSQGGGIVVTKPASLRGAIIGSLKEALGAYDEIK